jgi:tripartite-type tricarboxylate transporter receptor subunit TctC
MINAMKTVSSLGRAIVMAAGCLAASCLAEPCQAETSTDFYRGKQIVLLIASGVGGGYDTYARTFARHFSRHLPGQPLIVPKNLPAAGGLAAANTLYTVAPKDGLTIAALTNGVAMDPLLGNPAARFDALKFNWIGSIGKLHNVCATWFQNPVRTIEAAQAQNVTVAAAGPTSNTVIVPNVLNALLGTRFKVVAGYEPGTGMTLAVERGEVEGICGLSWSTIRASRPDWIAEGRLNVLVQMALNKLPELADVPSAIDLVSDPGKKQVLELVLMRQEMGRPVAAPPGVPADRIAVLREAFDATMRDPDFLAEAQRLQLEIDPLSAVKVASILATAYGAPTPIVEQAAALIQPAGRRNDGGQ